MSINVDAINPCLEFQNNIEKGLGVLDGMKHTMGPMKDAMADITDAGGRVDSVLVSRVNDQLTVGLTKSVQSMDTLTDQVEGLTGSCLNAVTGPVNDMAKAAVGTMNSVMGDMSNASVADLVELGMDMTDSLMVSGFAPVTEVLNKFTGMESLVGALGIEDILSGMDELLGCAAEGSDCGSLISSGQIDAWFAEITSFTEEFFLTPTGAMDLANVMDVAGIGGDIATAIDINANTFQDSVDAAAFKAKNLVASSVPNFIDVEQY